MSLNSLVPLKLVTALALVRVVPAARWWSAAPGDRARPRSVTEPLVAVRVTLPLVDRLAPLRFSVTLRSAVALRLPLVLLTLRLKITSLLAPVAASVTEPLPPAVMGAATTSVPSRSD